MNLSNSISAVFCAPASPRDEVRIFLLEGRFPDEVRRIRNARSLGAASTELLKILEQVPAGESGLRSWIEGLREVSTRPDTASDSGFFKTVR